MKGKTDKWLRRRFRFYNKKFFDNSIEEPEIIVFIPLLKEKCDGYTRWLSQHPTRLEIDDSLRNHPCLTNIVILHEMAHLKLGPSYLEDHGMLYGAEIVRLFNAGAYEGLL